MESIKTEGRDAHDDTNLAASAFPASFALFSSPFSLLFYFGLALAAFIL